MASVTRRIRKHLDLGRVRFAKQYLQNPVRWCVERLQWVDVKAEGR